MILKSTLGTINIYFKVFRVGDSRGALIHVLFSGERFIKRLSNATDRQLCGGGSEESSDPQGKVRAPSQVSEKGHPTSCG